MSKNNKKRKWRTRRTTRRKSLWRRINPLWILVTGSLLVLVLGVWLTTQGGPSAELAQDYNFPSFLAQAAANVQTAYAQVVSYQNEMEFMACYCGCGPGNGHRSLKDCFIAGTNPDGSIAYGQHALTWKLCVDEALDASRQIAQGKSLASIRADIDRRYSHFGPGTDTLLPTE